MTKFDRFNEAYDYLVWRKIVSTQADVALAMGSTQANVSLALNGTRLSPKFVARFCHTFDDIFSSTYILTGEGQLLADKAQKKPEPPVSGQTLPPNSSPRQVDEHTAELSFIDLAASLIKENEALRRDLKQAVEEVRSLRAEMSRDRDTLSAIRTSISKLLYHTAPEPMPLMAAENTDTL